MKIKIEKATINDLKKVQDLNNKLFELEFENFDPTLKVGWTYEKAGEDYFRDLLENSIVFVAVDDERVVGYLAGSIYTSSYNTENIAELENMFILEDYRKYGIGSKLVNEFKIYCKQNKIDSIKVTASSKNKNAIAFYNKNSFEEWDITLRCKL